MTPPTPPTELRDSLDAVIRGMVARRLTFKQATQAYRLSFVRALLRDEHGNQTRAARRLGLHRNNLAALIAKNPGLRQWLKELKHYYRPEELPVAGERRSA